MSAVDEVDGVDEGEEGGEVWRRDWTMAAREAGEGVEGTNKVVCIRKNRSNKGSKAES